MSVKRLQILLLVFIAFIGGYFVGVNKIQFDWNHYTPHITVINKEPPASDSLVDFSLFWDVWDKVTQDYYNKSAVDPKKMLYGAISGMVASIGDPYTLFLPPVQNDSFQKQLAGQFEGIGAELGMKDKQIIIIAPLGGSPAEKAGIKAGDAIMKVDGQAISTWTLPQTVEKIRGPKGTQVTLTVLHKGDSQTSDVTITRDTITVKSVDGWVKDVKDIDGISQDAKTKDAGEKVMYVRLSQFGDNTNQDWSALITSLLPKITSGEVKGMVLDLRNNPGGYLKDAQYIASEFLPEGKTVVIQDDGKGNTQSLVVNRQGALMNTPLVILINKGSASASEIVSGAIRDNGRGKLVGETSFGKGTIQTALDLGNSAGLHITIAKWLTPNGTWVHGKGLTPDVSVDLDSKDPSHDTQLEKAIQTVLGQ